VRLTALLLAAAGTFACATGTHQDDGGEDTSPPADADMDEGADAGADAPGDPGEEAAPEIEDGGAEPFPDVALPDCGSDAPAPTWSVAGVTGGDHLGTSLALGPDTNGDGYADLLVGAPGADGALLESGRAFLYDGLSGDLLAAFEGPGTGSEFGAAVSLGPDVDGDGRGEVLVGAPRASGTSFDTGGAFLYSGATGVLLAAYAGEATGDRFGAAVAVGPDADGDGRGDVLVGAPGFDAPGRADAGRAYLYGSADLAVPRKLTGEAADDQFGFAVSLGPDLDGDGRGDALVGAPFADPGMPAMPDAGKAYAITGDSGLVIFTLDGEQPGDRFGSAVSLGPRPTGGKRGDMLIGAPFADPGGHASAGRAYHFSGDAGALVRSFDGDVPGGQLGAAVALGPRLNGDVPVSSVADIALGAPAAANACDHAEAGRVRVINGLTGLDIAVFAGRSPGDRLGAAVSVGPDAGGLLRAGDLGIGAPGAGSAARGEATLRVDL